MPLLPKFLTDLFSPKSKPSAVSPIVGTQRPLSQVAVTVARDWDLEIDEVPIRDAPTAAGLLEMYRYCYEVREILSTICTDAFASTDGDDVGWAIADTLDDNKTPVNPDTLTIANDLKNRKQGTEYVIGGDYLKKALEWSLMFGDCFLELGIERDGKDYSITRSMYLPTFEVFRCESDTGVLERFEQRGYLSSSGFGNSGNAEIHALRKFEPFKVLHLRYEPYRLYGRALWEQALNNGNWYNLKRAAFNLHNAANDIGVNPELHYLPETATTEQKDIYKNEIDSKSKNGQITRYFLSNGYDIKKLSSQNPNLSSLVDDLLQCRYYMIPSGFPTYVLPGLQFAGGTKDLSRQPAMAYARKRYGFCQLLTKGIKQAIDLEIVLKKGWDWKEKHGQYRIVWPQWAIDGMVNPDESNITGIEDLDTGGDGGDVKSRYLALANGHKY